MLPGIAFFYGVCEKNYLTALQYTIMLWHISPKNCIFRRVFSDYSSSIKLLQVRSTKVLLKSYLILLSIELNKHCKWKTIPKLFPFLFSTKNTCINNLFIIVVFCFICYWHSNSQVKCSLVLSGDIFPRQMGLLSP